MSVAIRAITRLQDADDVNISLGAGVDEYALCWDNDTARFVLRAPFAGLLATGATTGATAQAQSFTNGIIGPSWKPAANSTTALQLQNATGTSVLNVDTTNGRVGIGTTAPTAKTEVAVTLTATSGIANGAAVYTTTMSPSANGVTTVRNVEYSIVSGNANEISSATNMLMYQYANSYMVSLVGVNVASRYGATANITAERMLYLSQDAKVGGASIATKTGLYIDAITHGNTNYAIYTNAGLNRIGDQMSIVGSADRVQLSVLGHTTQTDAIVKIIGGTATTNAVTNVLTLGHDTTGTAANGFGAGQLFTLESSTTAAQSAARIQALWNDATHATRKADLVLTAYDSGGEREGLRIRGDGSEPALGFYGVSPIARAVLATGVGATVDNVITALQNLGLVKQS